ISRTTTTRCRRRCSRNRRSSPRRASRSSSCGWRCSAGGRRKEPPMRKLVAIGVGAIVLLAVNWVIFSRERLLAEGQVVSLELAPVAPRSLMQGDYMALRFSTADSVGREKDPIDGRIVVRLDPQGVGRFVRLDRGETLAEREVALRYRVRDGRVK